MPHRASTPAQTSRASRRSPSALLRERDFSARISPGAKCGSPGWVFYEGGALSDGRTPPYPTRALARRVQGHLPPLPTRFAGYSIYRKSAVTVTACRWSRVEKRSGSPPRRTSSATGSPSSTEAQPLSPCSSPRGDRLTERNRLLVDLATTPTGRSDKRLQIHSPVWWALSARSWPARAPRRELQGVPYLPPHQTRCPRTGVAGLDETASIRRCT